MHHSLTNTIRIHRLQRGMTQAELALIVGISRQTLVRIESGAMIPSVMIALRIAKVLHVEASVIFSVHGGLLPV